MRNSAMNDRSPFMRRLRQAGPIGRRRLATVAVVAAITVVPTAALANPGSPSGKPTQQSSAATATESAAAARKSAAARGSTRAADKSAAAAKKDAAARSHGSTPAFVTDFAHRLGMSTAAAGRALKEIAGLRARNGRVDPTGAAFVAIARELRVGPARLADAWDAVKQNVPR